MVDTEEEIDVCEIAYIFLKGMHVDVKEPGKALHAEHDVALLIKKCAAFFVLLRPPYGISLMTSRVKIPL